MAGLPRLQRNWNLLPHRPGHDGDGVTNVTRCLVTPGHTWWGGWPLKVSLITICWHHPGSIFISSVTRGRLIMCAELATRKLAPDKNNSTVSQLLRDNRIMGGDWCSQVDKTWWDNTTLAADGGCYPQSQHKVSSGQAALGCPLICLSYLTIATLGLSWSN